MATQNVNIGINVSDNGTAKKVVKSFQEIQGAAERAQQAASGITQPVKSTMAPGGTGGSRKASQPTGSQGMMSGQDYGQARGSAGLTGAGARDFANQAQGLGGLVRLYATLAANIFAASAAYTALSNAMDTTNLVKGLDMLGATAGRNLGTLSKRLVEVTDGAVSMREAMTATAQASSAGMTNKNIERLALVAKNASLALGVAMPDALSRLSRGITKLEPELLDELGLFTKIGPATERYALEIGKSVSALTDFERRQAFANAVLEEGEKKFGALAQAASNPYDKLLATLKNVLQSGGELINKVLGPIVGLLAESPGALGAVLAGLGVVLLKQALPAIGQMRAGLRNTAEEALATAKAFKESFGDEFQTRLEQRFKIPDLEAGVRKAQADLAKLKVPDNLAASVQKLASGEDISAKNIRNVEEVLRKKNLTVETGMRGSRQASEAQIQQAKQESVYIKAVISDLKQKQALEAAGTGALGVASAAQGITDPQVIALQKYDALRSKVDRANIISNAAQNAQIMGIRGAFAQLNNEIAEKGITGIQKYATQAQGGLAAVGTRVIGLIGAFGNIGMAVGAAVAAFQLLDSFMSKNAKQTENFTKALTTADDSVANVTRTLAAATSTEGFATRTIDNTVAFSNALNELTSSASEVIKLSREADRAAGLWDNFWDSIFSVVDKDRASKLAKTVADQLKSGLLLLQREGLADEYTAEIKKILNVDSLEDTKKVAEAFRALTKTQQDAILLLQTNANRALGNINSNLQSFKSTTDAALRAQKTLANSFIDSSPMFVYGQSLIAVSKGLTKIIESGPDRVVQALQEVATNTEKMGLFGDKFVESFAGISNVFLQQVKNIEASRNALVDYQKTLEQVSKPAKTSGLPFGSMEVGVQANDTRQRASIASSDVREIQRAINAQQDGVIRDAIKLAKDAAKAIYEEGLQYINKAIREAQNAAAITVGRALSVNLTGIQKIEADNTLRQQEIKYQLASIDVSEQVLNVQDSLVNEMRLANALQAEANILLKNQGKTDKPSLDQNAEATRQVAMARAAARGDTSGLGALDVADVERRRKDEADLRRKGTQAQRVALGAQSTASTIGVTAQRPGALIAEAEELAKITDRTNATLLSRTQILNTIANVNSVELTKAKQATELAQTENKQKRELDEIQARIKAATDLKLVAEKQNTVEGQALATQYTAQITKLQEIKKATEDAQKADTSLIRTKNKQEILSDELTILGRRAELDRSSAQLQSTLATTALDTRSQEFALYSSAYDVSRQVVVSQQAALEIQKTQLETSTAVAQAEAELQVKREEAQARKTALGEGETAQALVINAELDRQVTLTNNTIAGLNAQGAAKTSILEKTREINLEQERYNVLLTQSEAFAYNLTAAFGQLGSALGDVTRVFTEIAISSEKRAKSEALMNKQLADAKESKNLKAIAAAEDDLAKTKKKNTKAELDDNIKAISSTKKVFSEKTFAYKALDKIEKVMHVARLAMDIKEMISDTLKTGTSVFNSVKRTGAAVIEAGVDGVKAVVKAIASLPFPLNLVAGAATAAVVGGLLAKIGGKKPSSSTSTGGAPSGGSSAINRDSLSNFSDKFGSSTLKSSINTQVVSELFRELNLALPKTREEVFGLVNTLAKTDPEGANRILAATDSLDRFYETLETSTTKVRGLEIELLKAEGRTLEATSALVALETKGMTPLELATYNYTKQLESQIRVVEERKNLEQRLFQLGNDIVALRSIELSKLDESNRGLQLQIWLVEDYNKALASSAAAIEKATQDITAAENAAQGIQSRATDQYVAATEKVAAAQKTIADLAIEAAKKMQGFGKSLREFVAAQLMPESRQANAGAAFTANTALALTGDVSAIQKVPELAQAAIDAARAGASSSQAFNAARATILAGVSSVAQFAETQAGLTDIPAEQDPLVLANLALESALIEQTKALQVANTLGASLVKVPEDLIALYLKANEDLATAILKKTAAEEAQRLAQEALDKIVGNTGKLITAITGSSEETIALAVLVEKELSSGFKLIDTNLDGKLSYEELLKGLEGKATDKDIQALIKATDSNSDGLIDAYELQSASITLDLSKTLNAGFKLLDTNLDGKLSYEELVKGLDGKATDKDIQALIKAADLNADGLIDAYELESTSMTKSIVDMLKTIDTNLDGKLSYDELVKGLDGKATDAEIKALIKAADLNADNLIDAFELELFNNVKSIVEALGTGFDLLDTNLDGKLSNSEFMAGMAGKASDDVLSAIFNLVDGDNDKIITATELTAAKSALNVTASDTISTNTKNTADGQKDAFTLAKLSYEEALVNITDNTNLSLANDEVLANILKEIAISNAKMSETTSSSGATVSKGKSSTVKTLAVGAGLGILGFILFSDSRTKKNITHAKTLDNGINLYDYTYKEPYADLYGSDRKRGVMAQEIKGQYPDAVGTAANGMYTVDYSKLPIDSSELKFARGGVFSNQVVTRPTSFSLAQMGEAGPEAIMPLSRTRNGRLGVVSQTQPDTAFNTQIQNQNTALIDEVRKLREEVNLLRYEARATASATGKTTRILERVTQNGDSLLVTDAATV